MTGENDNQRYINNIQQWLAARKEAAATLDPHTVTEVTFEWGPVLDPYGVRELPPEAICVGRIYFAYAPETDIWVSFHDIPGGALKIIRERMAAGQVHDPADDEVLFS